MSNTDAEDAIPSVFIIKKNQGSLKSAETYLKNRKWNIRSAVDIKQALISILKEPPKYIIISVEHPHPKVMVLPKVMAQALKCVVIPYSESNSPLILSKLNEINSEFILFPPVSGPAIERIIKRVILKEKEAALNKDHPDIKTSTHHTKDGNTFVAKGSSDPEAEAIAIKGAREALAKMFSDEHDETPGVLGHLETSKPSNHKIDLMIQKGVDGKTNAHLDKGSSDHSLGHNNMQKAGTHLDQNHSQSKANGHGNFNRSSSDSEAQKANGNGIGNGNDHGNFNRSSSDSEAQKANGSESQSALADAIDQSDALMATSLDTKSSRILPKISMDELSITVDTAMSKASSEHNSLLVKGSKQALESTVVCVADEINNPEPVEVATNVSCIIVQSSRFSGYLVVAMGEKRKIEDSFMNILKKNLFKFLKDNGEKLTDEDQLNLKLEPVEFQDWAIEHAEFLRKSIHKGGEVAMAFFPYNEIQIPLENTSDDGMLAVDITKLRGDLKMEFDIYLHMPLNNKYVLFTPKGGVLYSEQKDRLLKKGVEKMHLHKTSVKDVKKYVAQNYLNDKIQEFQQKDNNSKKAKAS